MEERGMYNAMSWVFCAPEDVEGCRMWDEIKQARFNALRIAERQGTLTEAEGVELLALAQELDVLEAAYLHPATERVRQEREALGEQNSKLEELLREQQDYLAEIRTLVADLEVRAQRWRQRYMDITGRDWVEDKAETSG
jgi:predicted DNA-binding protein (UPF0278 family)